MNEKMKRKGITLVENAFFCDNDNNKGKQKKIDGRAF